MIHFLLHRFLSLGILILAVSTSTSLYGFEFKGRANTWGLIQKDDLDSTTVAVVYRSSNNQLVGIVVGADIRTTCSNSAYTCIYRTIGDLGELSVERRTDAGTFNHGSMSGLASLYNFGLDAKGSEGPWLSRINGNFTGTALHQRTLLGDDRYRFRFSDLYQQYQNSQFEISAGRKAVLGGAVVDGLEASYFWGPESQPDSKLVGLFLGFAPDPISKNPSSKYITLGPTFRFIPDFSAQSESRLLVENALVSEFYKGDLNRFYLFSRVHFTPSHPFSVMLYNTLDLPWSGYDGELKSSHFSLQTFYRPKAKWFFSLGFSQFRIDRYLKEEAVKWVTENGSQRARLGDSLDKSQRYRIDFRVSYRPATELQPYLKVRLERRTFDSNKTLVNADDGATANTDFSLLTRTNAYSGTLGSRIFLWDHLDSDLSLTLTRRFQSSGWNAIQTITWEQGRDWSVDTSIQFASSNRTIKNSIAATDGTQQHAYDLYAGVGGMIRLPSDFQLQLHYDWANEDDKTLDERITTHTGLVRLDYSF